MSETRARHKRDQVRLACDAQGIGESGHDSDDLPAETEFLQGIIDWSRKTPLSRRHDMPGRRIALRCHGTLQQRMSVPNHTQEFVAEEELGAHLWRKLSENANFKIDLPFPERLGILDRFRREPQADPWRRVCNGGHQGSREQLDKALVGANGEGPLQRGDFELASLRAENSSSFASKLVNPIAQLDGAGSWDKSAPGAHQQRVARGGPEPREGPAHRRRTEAETAGRAGHATLGQQRIERRKQVQVEIVHNRNLHHVTPAT